MGDRELLAHLREPIAIPHGLGISDLVQDALHDVVTTIRIDHQDTGVWVYRTCGLCDQAINPLVKDRVLYRFSDEELDATLLAHLIQSHGWTRETPRLEGGAAWASTTAPMARRERDSF